MLMHYDKAIGHNFGNGEKGNIELPFLICRTDCLYFTYINCLGI